MMRNWVGVMASAVMVSVLAGGPAWAAGPTTQPATSQPAGAESPRALLETLDQAVGAMDAEAIARCVSPQFAEPIRTMMQAASDFRTKLRAAKKAVADKFGPDLAAGVFKDAEPQNNSPLHEAAADGKVDWDKVKITVEGETATVQVNDKQVQDVTMQKLAGRWYVIPGETTPAKMAQLAEVAKGNVAKMIKGLEDFRQKVVNDQVAKDKVQAELDDCMTKAMGGGPGAGPMVGDDDDTP